MKRVDYLNRIPISFEAHVTNVAFSAKHDLNYTDSNAGQSQSGVRISSTYQN